MTADVLPEVTALRRLTGDQRAAVAATGRDVAVDEGARLFEEGRPATACWVITSGQVAVEALVPGRGRVVVQTVGDGDVLGWSWLVPPYRWHFGATAQSPVTAVRLDAAGLRELAESDPELGYHLALGLFETVLDRLQNTRARLLDLYGSPRAG